MPIVTIESNTPADSSGIPRMIAEARDDGALALRCPPSNVWVIFRTLPPAEALLPPMVTVRAQSGRTSAERQAFVEAIAAAVGRGLSLPAEKIWIHYQEMRPQDVWFEGRWANSLKVERSGR